MIFIIILFLISILLEGVIPNIFKDIMPIFIIAIIFIFNLIKTNNKTYYITLFIMGFIYDLLYTSSLLINTSLFLFVGFLCDSSVDNSPTFIKSLINYYVFSVLYILILFYFTYIYVPHSMIKLLIIYKESLIINTLYFSILYFVFIFIKNIISNRNKKKSYF